MKYFNSKKKKIALGLILAVVVLVGVAMPVNHAFAVLGMEAIEVGLKQFFFIEIPALFSNAILTITSWFLGMAGILLNEVIKFTVVDMAKNINDVGGINIAWRVFRDLANLAFVFILLDVAIRTIIGVGSVNTKKMLVNVIIIALLLNFSLFFTKIMIDGSNILTLGFYNKISVSGGNNDVITGISGAFMSKLGVSGVFDVTGIANIVKSNGFGNVGKILLFGIFGSILFLVTGFVFLAAALMFIIRYVTFIFLLLLSPLAFASMALPHDNYSKKWWDKLMDNIIFAPVFMVLTWATLTVLGDMLSSGPGGVTSIVSAISQPIPTAGLVLNFIIVIVMMVATLVISKELGAAGASGALKYGRKLRGQTTSWIGRNTAGRFAANIDRRLAQSDSMLGRAADSRVGRFARGYTTGALAESKFGGGVSRKADLERIKKEKTDIANNRRINKLRGTVESTKTADLTLTELAGIHPTKRAAAKAERVANRDLVEKTFQQMSNKELETLSASDLEKNVQYMSAGQFEHVVEKSEKFNEQEKEGIKNARFAALRTALDPTTGDPEKAKGLTRALSDKEIEVLGSDITDDRAIKDYVKNLSQSQIDGILKSQKFTSTQKKKIRDEIIRPLKEALMRGSAGAAEVGIILGKMKAQQIAKLDSVILLDNNIISQLTPKMMAEMPKELDNATLKQIGDKIKAVVASGGTHPAFDYIDPAGNRRGKDFFN